MALDLCLSRTLVSHTLAWLLLTSPEMGRPPGLNSTNYTGPISGAGPSPTSHLEKGFWTHIWHPSQGYCEAKMSWKDVLNGGGSGGRSSGCLHWIKSIWPPTFRGKSLGLSKFISSEPDTNSFSKLVMQETKCPRKPSSSHRSVSIAL